METYGELIFLISFVGIFISIIVGITIALCKRTLKYTWLFLCIVGFCFFTAFRHIMVLIAYGDVADPNYETYKNWNVCRFILSDMIRLVIWSAIGVWNYLAFIRRNKLFKYLLILGAGVLFITIVFLLVFSYIPLSRDVFSLEL